MNSLESRLERLEREGGAKAPAYIRLSPDASEEEKARLIKQARKGAPGRKVIVVITNVDVEEEA